MEKTAKITRTIFKNEWANPKGGSIYYHEIELDNGDKGQIGCKDKEPKFLNPNEMLTYTIETTEKGSKIKRAMPEGGVGGPFNKKSTYVPVDQRAQNIGFAMRYTVDLVIGNKVEYDKMGTAFENIFGMLDNKFQALKGEAKAEPKQEAVQTTDEPVNEGQIAHVKKLVAEKGIFNDKEGKAAIEKVKTLKRSMATTFIQKLVTESDNRKQALLAEQEEDLPF